MTVAVKIILHRENNPSLIAFNFRTEGRSKMYQGERTWQAKGVNLCADLEVMMVS